MKSKLYDILSDIITNKGQISDKVNKQFSEYMEKKSAQVLADMEKKWKSENK